jgi:hypothetical protein
LEPTHLLQCHGVEWQELQLLRQSEAALLLLLLLLPVPESALPHGGPEMMRIRKIFF